MPQGGASKKKVSVPSSKAKRKRSQGPAKKRKNAPTGKVGKRRVKVPKLIRDTATNLTKAINQNIEDVMTNKFLKEGGKLNIVKAKNTDVSGTLIPRFGLGKYSVCGVGVEAGLCA